MKLTEEKKIACWFKDYAAAFAGKSGRLAPMLQLKLDHSRRVSAIAAGIASELGFAPNDVRAARMLGLLHDVARFSQFERHRTFRDELSFNHGTRGAAIMKKCTALSACSPADIRRIIAGIRHHNRACLPARLPAPELEFVKIARDADKMDIFYVLYDTWKSGALRRSPEIALMVNLDGGINPGALAELRRSSRVSVASIRSLADFFLLQLSWVYDLNFRPSYRLLARRAVIDRLAEVLPSTPAILREISRAREYARRRAQPG